MNYCENQIVVDESQIDEFNKLDCRQFVIFDKILVNKNCRRDFDICENRNFVTIL